MTENIHRLAFCGKDKLPLVCIECAHDAALEEEATRGNSLDICHDTV